MSINLVSQILMEAMLATVYLMDETNLMVGSFSSELKSFLNVPHVELTV